MLTLIPYNNIPGIVSDNRIRHIYDRYNRTSKVFYIPKYDLSNTIYITGGYNLQLRILENIKLTKR